MSRLFSTYVLCVVALLAVTAFGVEAHAQSQQLKKSPPNRNAVPPQTGSFALSLSLDKVVILQGGQTTVRAMLERRNGFVDAVKVTLAGLPIGVSANTVTFPAGVTQLDIVLNAKTGAPHSLPTLVSVDGHAANTTVSRQLSVTVRGVAGSVDTTFGGGVVRQAVGLGEDSGNAIAVQSDGMIIVAGASATSSGTAVSLLRFQRDGGLDRRFGSGGKVLTVVGTRGNDSANAVAVQDDGSIIVAGASEGAGSGLDFMVLRYGPDGTLDTTFGNGGKVVVDFFGDADRAWALMIQPDGRIVVGGEANAGSTASGVDFALLRLNADGSPDTSFGTRGRVTTPMKAHSGTDIIRALALQTIKGAQHIVAVGGEGDFEIARYKADGTLDSSFGNLGRVQGVFVSSIGGARAVTRLPDGEVLVAGHINHRFAAVRLTSSGSLDTGFASGGRFEHALVTNWNEATSMVHQSDGKLILGGWVFPRPGSSGDFAALRLNVDGSLDTDFGSGGVTITPTAPGTKSDLSKALVLQADGRVPTVRVIQAGESNDSNQDVTLVRLWL